MKGPERYAGEPDKIVGVSSSVEANAKMQIAVGVLRNQQIMPYEREKTPQELAIMKEIFARLPEFIEEYGSVNARYISLDQVHMLKESSEHLDKIRPHDPKGSRRTGNYVLNSGRIEVVSQGENYLKMAKTLVHELIHAHSFYSVDVNTDPHSKEVRGASPRRLGLAIYEDGKPDEVFLNFMNEAITEELTKKFCEKYFPQIEGLKEPFDAYQKGKTPSATSLQSPTLSVVNELLQTQPLHTYRNERLEVVALLEILYERNKDKFASYDEVFKLFSRGMFRGDLLPMARLIEKTLGKGEFRKLAERMRRESPDGTQKILGNL